MSDLYLPQGRKAVGTPRKPAQKSDELLWAIKREMLEWSFDVACQRCGTYADKVRRWAYEDPKWKEVLPSAKRSSGTYTMISYELLKGAGNE